MAAYIIPDEIGVRFTGSQKVHSSTGVIYRDSSNFAYNYVNDTDSIQAFEPNFKSYDPDDLSHAYALGRASYTPNPGVAGPLEIVVVPDRRPGAPESIGFTVHMSSYVFVDLHLAGHVDEDGKINLSNSNCSFLCSNNGKLVLSKQGDYIYSSVLNPNEETEIPYNVPNTLTIPGYVYKLKNDRYVLYLGRLKESGRWKAAYINCGYYGYDTNVISRIVDNFIAGTLGQYSINTRTNLNAAECIEKRVEVTNERLQKVPARRRFDPVTRLYVDTFYEWQGVPTVAQFLST